MLNFYTYTLPFNTVFKTGAGEFRERAGIIVQYKEPGIEILSEASPLPGFSVENLSHIKRALHSHQKQIGDFLASDFSLHQLREFLDILPDFPSLQFSISYTGIQLLSRRKQLPVYVLLNCSFHSLLYVNDVMGAENLTGLTKRVERGVDQGFQTFKLKAPAPSVQLANVLTEIHQLFPGITFRLDANQNWSESTLKRDTARFEHLPIQYIEEPIPIVDPDHLAQLNNISHLPVACDESIPDLSSLKNFLLYAPRNYYIIKPQLFGNILNLCETISPKKALEHQRVVITTLLESGIGRTMVTEIAAIAGTPELAHGLHTGHLFKKKLFKEMEVTNGILQLPDSGTLAVSITNTEPNILQPFS